jgi:ABC-type Zn uptake system ZnuABC Zn-binding protein ZnuA
MLKKLTLIFLLLSPPLSSQIKIVTTLHPFKEIIQKVSGERGIVIAILKPGLSPHTYRVSPSEVKAIEGADVLFYGSEDLDGWVVKYEHKDKIELISLLPKDSLLTVKTNDDEVVGTDPHFWTDPLLIRISALKIADVLCEIDSDGCKEYRENAILFSNELDRLHKKIKSIFSVLEKNNVMLSHPFFAYFLNRFNFKIESLIEPIPGKEPTAKDLKKLIDIAIQTNVAAIFIHSQLPEKAAEIVSESAGIKIYTLDPIGGVEGKITYDELLLYNTEIILKALR